MMIKGVIFDFDGVIVDSEKYSIRLYKKIFKEMNKKFTNELFIQLLGATNDVCTNILINELGSFDNYKYFNNEYEKLFVSAYENGEIKLKKGAYNLINYLIDNNIPFSLATSSSKKRLEYAFKKTKFITNPFKISVTSEDITHSKPNPEIFYKAANKIKVDIKDCLIVEDSYKGVRAAYNSGAKVCMVPDLFEPDNEIRSMCNYIMKDLIEVENFVKKEYRRD